MTDYVEGANCINLSQCAAMEGHGTLHMTEWRE